LQETKSSTWRGSSKHKTRQFEPSSESGAAWDQIVAVARKDPDIELIVIGTHGRTGVQRALIGSVAERVVRHAPCLVMVVRPARAE